MPLNNVLRRPDSHASSEKQALPIRLSGTNPNTQIGYERNPDDGPLGPANGREGNDHPTPDYQTFELGRVEGDRLQDFANSHLSEGPAPGRIPRRWTSLVRAVLGKHVTGEPNGDTGVIVANQSGGAEDGLYIPHIQIPRGSIIARAYSRTVDDAAPIPGIFVADPTRR